MGREASCLAVGEKGVFRFHVRTNGVAGHAFTVTALDGDQIGSVRFMLVGLALMLLMIFRPQGVLGNKKELAFDVR